MAGKHNQMAGNTVYIRRNIRPLGKGKLESLFNIALQTDEIQYICTPRLPDDCVFGILYSLLLPSPTNRW